MRHELTPAEWTQRYPRVTPPGHLTTAAWLGAAFCFCVGGPFLLLAVIVGPLGLVWLVVLLLALVARL